jgi:tetratricopeptide (TPR) repeat protein
MRKPPIYLLFLPLLLAACASKPDPLIQSAERALEQSRSAEAQTYAPESYQEAVDALEAARREIAEQDQRFAFRRDYGRAEELLQRTVSLAEQTSVQAEAGKEEARRNAEANRRSAEQLLEQAREALERAPRGKGARLDLQVLNRDLSQAQSSYESGVREYEGGQYQSALERFQQAIRMAEAVLGHLPS